MLEISLDRASTSLNCRTCCCGWTNAAAGRSRFSPRFVEAMGSVCPSGVQSEYVHEMQFPMYVVKVGSSKQGGHCPLQLHKIALRALRPAWQEICHSGYVRRAAPLNGGRGRWCDITLRRRSWVTVKSLSQLASANKKREIYTALATWRCRTSCRWTASHCHTMS